MAVQAIVNPILVEAGFEERDYSACAASVKSLFMPRFVTDAEEYGLPSQLAMKLLRNRYTNFDSIDHLLETLTRAHADGLDEFEGDLYRSFADFL